MLFPIQIPQCMLIAQYSHDRSSGSCYKRSKIEENFYKKTS
jgi:hypothetical protein